jgi:phosphoribosylaminoimidazolecarboxamide formyltransferase/IMP cyclohydrolase
MKAIISVFDKTGVGDIASALHDAGYELVSTGSTGQTIADAGVSVTQVSELTGFPEVLDGRVKTLHPRVHAGILARRGLESHSAQLEEHGIDTIDVVVGNLYPFVQTVSKQGVTLDDALENIDIGGPTMIRAAAKNFPDVAVIVDPADYGWIGERLADGRPLTLEERRGLALKAFQHVALYDTAISRYLANGDALPDEFTLGFTRTAGLRYGENPHQAAGLYRSVLSSGGIVAAEQLHGPEISFNNVMDADAAWRVVSDFDQPAVTIVKHNNPCGLAVNSDQPTAYRSALDGDSVSAYGGIVGVNRTLTAATARAMKGTFYEIVVAPDYEPDALDVLRKRKKTRVLRVPAASGPTEGVDVRKVSGGALLQAVDAINEDPATWEVKTKRAPTKSELADLAFAWKAAKHIKSNTIVLARDATMVGMGAGQPNRVTSVHLAIRIAGDKSKGSVMASDAFMPFADNVELAAEGGVVAIAQPGGSMRDDEVIEAADRLGIAMVFTGTRHFRH